LWGLRRKRSLLVANGHPHAGLYPLGMLNDEAGLVIERQNNLLASEAVLLQAAASTLFAEEAGQHFNELIERMTEE